MTLREIVLIFVCIPLELCALSICARILWACYRKEQS